jgi:hypothetical protein
MCILPNCGKMSTAQVYHKPIKSCKKMAADYIYKPSLNLTSKME